MVIKHLDDSQGQARAEGQLDVYTQITSQASGDGFISYHVAGLAPDHPATPTTGMRDEILLASWLIVLLRTREDGQVQHDWAYKGRATAAKEVEPADTLSTAEVMPSLQSSVQQTSEAISRHIKRAVVGQYTATSSPASLLLSTGSLSRTAEGTRDEVSEWPDLQGIWMVTECVADRDG